jgi:hypothetical protein
MRAVKLTKTNSKPKSGTLLDESENHEGRLEDYREYD